MANTTDTTSFNLDLNSLVEEAFERCGHELRSGYDLRTARRSLNLLLLDWANRGINLWTIEQGTVPLVVGTATYDLPVDTVDLLDHVLRTGSGTFQMDTNLNRLSVSDYVSIPNKNITGRPVQLWIERRTGATDSTSTAVPPRVTLWPVPDAGYTLAYWRLRRIQDAGNGVNGQDIPFRFLPCLVAGLAYYLSLKLPNAIERRAELKMEYDEQWLLAAEEDREKADLRIVPRFSY